MPGFGRGEDLLLVLGGEAAEQRQHFHRQGAAPAGPAGEVGGQRLGDLADLPLSGEEDQHVTGALGGQLVDSIGDGLGEVAFDRVDVLELIVLVHLWFEHERPVADLDGIGAAGDLDDRRGLEIPGGQAGGEVLGEALGVDRGGGDDHLEVGALLQDLFEVAEDHVDVQGPLVGLVDDDRVVALQEAVTADLGEQDAVGHELQPGAAGGLAGETHLVADGPLPQLLAELGGDAGGDGAGRDAPRLRVADELPAATEPQLEQHLGDLRGLTGAGGAGDDDDLVLRDRLLDVLAALGDGQVSRVADPRARCGVLLGGAAGGGIGARGGRGHGGATLRGRSGAVVGIPARREERHRGCGAVEESSRRSLTSALWMGEGRPPVARAGSVP